MLSGSTQQICRRFGPLPIPDETENVGATSGALQLLDPCAELRIRSLSVKDALQNRQSLGIPEDSRWDHCSVWFGNFHSLDACEAA
jgi:hypothetical protein